MRVLIYIFQGGRTELYSRRQIVGTHVNEVAHPAGPERRINKGLRTVKEYEALGESAFFSCREEGSRIFIVCRYLKRSEPVNNKANVTSIIHLFKAADSKTALLCDNP